MWVMATSILWTSLGVLLFQFRFMPSYLPRLLGRSLYWAGVPLQILALARRSDFSEAVWLPPMITVLVLFLGLGLANLSLHFLKQLTYQAGIRSYHTECSQISDALVENSRWGFRLPFAADLSSKIWPRQRSGQGSFVLASMLGNTGFVGLAIAPAFVSTPYLGWIVLYGVTHNLLGSYGLGVFLASYFGRQKQQINWWIQLRDVLSVPALWAFAIGWSTRYIELPVFIELGLQASLWFVIPGAFLLIGMQLSQLRGLKSLQLALVPATLKMLVLPGLAGLGLTLFGVSGDARFALVLMSGMPTAFANLILAEEYNLDRQLAAGSIVLSTVVLPLMIPFWLALFG